MMLAMVYFYAVNEEPSQKLTTDCSTLFVSAVGKTKTTSEVAARLLFMMNSKVVDSCYDKLSLSAIS